MLVSIVISITSSENALASVISNWKLNQKKSNQSTALSGNSKKKKKKSSSSFSFNLDVRKPTVPHDPEPTPLNQGLKIKIKIKIVVNSQNIRNISMQQSWSLLCSFPKINTNGEEEYYKILHCIPKI